MIRNKLAWIIGGIILVILLVFGGLWLSPSTEALSEEEIKAAAQSKYPGIILHTEKMDDDYEIVMQMETGSYTIRIDSSNGNVLSLIKTKSDQAMTSKKLSEAQITEKIATHGELQSIQFVEQTGYSYYKAIVKKEHIETELKINPINGEIIEAKEVLKEPAVPVENKLINQQEALNIAADHLKGIADDDAELHQPAGHVPYYLVEVEIENGENDREAIVQVDAYTGTVKSVNWED